jgi:ribonuclease J
MRNRKPEQQHRERRNDRHGRNGNVNEKEKKMTILPLGGLDMIGRNMTLFEYEDSIIIVDCGIMFPTSEMPGVDYIIPDFDYVIKNKNKVKAIVITHGHEDHIGSISFLLQRINAPIYGTRLTLGLIRSRLEERPPVNKPELIEIAPRETFQAGPFRVEFIRVNHSIVDSVGLAIKTSAGTIIHTGDFKIDYSPADNKVTDIYRFAEYGEQGVLLLMSDSTNAERPGYTGSENTLTDALSDTFATAKGRIIVATFASNINRIQQVLDAAMKYNRKVVVSGRSMQKNIEIAHSLGYLNYKDNLVVDINEGKTLQDKRAVVICTGTQGEPMSALTRMAAGTHKHFVIGPNDRVVITASVIPGNERGVSNVINALLKLGSDVFYEQDRDLHVSGHASQEELKLMLSLVKPKFFMPIHGEYKQLRAHARLAEGIGIRTQNIIIPQNGDVLSLSKSEFKKVDAINVRNIFVDGTFIGDLDSDIIRDRQTISSEGLILVTIVLNEGMLISEPQVLLKGFAAEQNDKILGFIQREIEHKLDKTLRPGVNTVELGYHIKKNLKSALFRQSMREPEVEVQVLEL